MSISFEASPLCRRKHILTLVSVSPLMSHFKLATSQEEEEEVRISSSLFERNTEELEVRGERFCWIYLPRLSKTLKRANCS